MVVREVATSQRYALGIFPFLGHKPGTVSVPGSCLAIKVLIRVLSLPSVSFI